MTIAINGSGTITGISAGGLPDAVITQPELAAGVAGTGPAFSAYQSTLQSLSGSAYTKVQFQTEIFDTNSNFDNATNYRFTPTVAGYYIVTGQIYSVNGATSYQAAIYKNGTAIQYGGYTLQISNTTGLVYLNGSTDYVEFYAFASLTGNSSTGQTNTYFQASLVRAA